MKISDLLNELYESGIKISVKDDKIQLISLKKQDIPIHLTEKIRKFKNEIIAYFIEEQKKYKRIFEKIKNSEKKDYYNIFSAQKGLYLLQKKNPESVAYNLPFEITLNKNVDVKHLENTFKKLIEHHDSLRTSFELVDGIPAQRIHDTVEFNIEEFEIDAKAIEKNRKEFVKPFDLNKAPLFRANLFKVKGGNSILMLDMHHIINDGTSQNVLLQNFHRFYNGDNLPKIPLQFKDFSEWIIKSNNQKANIKKQEEHWLNLYKDNPDALNLPTDFLRASEQQFNGAIVNFALTKEETKKVKASLKDHDITLFMFFFSAFNILLSKLSGQDDIVVGCPAAGRKHSDINDIVGMFVNSLALRTKIDKNRSVRRFIEEVKLKTLKDLDNQEYHFEELVNKLAIERDASRNPLFDVMFNVQNQSETIIDLSSLRKGEYTHEYSISKFDLGLIVCDCGEQILITIEYSSKLFKPETIERYIESFLKIVDQLNDCPDRLISDIEILEENKKRELLQKFNNKNNDYTGQKSLIDFFETTVKKFPDKIALVAKDKSITYGGLYKMVCIVANQLDKKGVKKSDIVCILDNRSINSVIGILGILKTGAAYLPIDSETPVERIKYYIKDSSSKIILTAEELKDSLDLDLNIVNLSDNDYSENITKYNELCEISSYDISQIIYTSGSTGIPKGVVITHGKVLNHLIPLINDINIDSSDKVLLFSPMSFDASVEQFWLPLLTGGELISIEKSLMLDKIEFEDYINKKAVTCLYMVPAYLQNLKLKGLKNLGKIVMGGDECKSDHVKSLYEQLDFYNEYGPTETTVTATRHLVKGYEKNVKIPIGKPVANKNIYILDEDLKMLPVGIIGEIFIGGPCVSDGYLNNVELTTEKFIKNPYSPNQIMYKTGDLAKWLPDGNIEFAGRKDEQVKIRGFRIELGEVKTCLLKIYGIKDAAVLVRIKDNGDKVLCAYVVTNEFITKDEIRNYLSKEIPYYMIPHYVEIIEKLPLTSGGKINVNALPDIIKDDVSGNDEKRDELSELVYNAWSKVLNLKTIKSTDRFFEIGGDSLKAMQLSAELQKSDIKVTMADLMKYPTISDLSKFIKTVNRSGANKGENSYVLRPIEKKEYYPLTYSQSFFIKSLMEGVNPNMKGTINLSKIDKPALKNAVKNLLNKHENLRTNFIKVNGELRQKVRSLSELNFNLEEIVIENKKDYISELKQQIKTDYNKPFNLEKDCLIRMKLFCLPNDNYVFYFVIHHILFDIWSSNLLIKELQSLYKQGIGNKNNQNLNQLKINYKDYSERLYDLIKSQYGEELKRFWIKGLFKATEKLKLKLGNSSNNNKKKGNLITYHSPIPVEIYEHIIKCSIDKNYNVYTVLLAAMNLVMSKLQNEKEVVVRCPVACRQNIDVNKIIGFIANEIFLPVNIDDTHTGATYLETVSRDFTEAMNYQMYPSLLLANDLGISYDNLKDDMAILTLNHHKYKSEYKGLYNINSRNKTKQLSEEVKNILCLCHEYKNGIVIEWGFCENIHTKEKMIIVEKMFFYFLNQLLNNPDEKINNYLNKYSNCNLELILNN